MRPIERTVEAEDPVGGRGRAPDGPAPARAESAGADALPARADASSSVHDPGASRRAFLALCGGAGAALACLADAAPAAGGQRHAYPRAQLVDERGRPLRCEQLAPNTEYIFHYPFRATPCATSVASPCRT